ncbi:Mitochondrial fission protein [Lachnellula willkommii]|uniref:Mitochondrial fission 1 protein n=1 Tax=Lachnellula willkommii TaxID=215461 RepID=A0A559MFY3_9HELO|nr:Mitochondrial fission protein [Lachnellula willkommii]
MGSSLPCRLLFFQRVTVLAGTPAELAMLRSLPRATYANSTLSPLKPAELQVLRAQYEKEGEHVGVQTKFNFAWGLIKSNVRQEQQEGVRLLSDIFRTSPERRRECLYYLALGNYKLGNYAEARRYNDLLLDKEPANLQASSLRGLIDDKVAKEGMMGVAILSGVAIAAGVVGGMIFKGVGNRKR